MDAQVQDFMGGTLRECRELAGRWTARRPAGLDRRLALLSAWTGLARALPADAEGRLDLDPEDYRRIWGEARALRVLAGAGFDPAHAAERAEALYRALTTRFDPADPWRTDHSRVDVSRWAHRHAKAMGDLPGAAMAFLDFIRLDPLATGSDAVAALLAAALAGPPLLPVLGWAERREEGYRHALEAGLTGDHSVWIAFYLAQARRALKRLPILADGAETLRRRWLALFTRAPFGAESAARLTDALLEVPIITPTWVADTGVPTDVLRDGLVLLFAADDALDVFLPGQGLTLLSPPLRLLVAER